MSKDINPRRRVFKGVDDSLPVMIVEMGEYDMITCDYIGFCGMIPEQILGLSKDAHMEIKALGSGNFIISIMDGMSAEYAISVHLDNKIVPLNTIITKLEVVSEYELMIERLLDNESYVEVV